MPFKAKGFDDVLHTIRQPMCFPGNIFVPFHRTALRAIKYEER